MSQLILQDIRKSFGAFTALKGISLDVADGEFIVLVGPSGCGKSTLLRTIAGLETVSSGSIHLADRNLTQVPTRDRNVAMVFQSYALFPHLTVADNIGFGMKIRKSNSTETARKVAAAAGMLGLDTLMDRYPRELSGGQRQRVAMGRAIVRDPEVFLFDEPLSNLDAKLRVQMRTEIKALRQRLGVTSIYVTHDQDEAMTMADRIVVLNAGDIEQIGTPMELYDRPSNMFVAGFMGSPPMNFVHGSIEGNDFVMAGERLALRLPDACPAELVLGLRPEALRFDPEGHLSGTVEVVEPQGAQTLVSVKLLDSTMIYVRGAKSVSEAPGNRVRLAFDDRDIHLFDGKTGTRLDTAQQGNTT